MKKFVRAIQSSRATTNLLGFCLRLPGFAYIWALLTSASIRREIKMVYAGQKAYDRSVRSSMNRYELRRSIHRIEKGLTMRPRRNRFALDYIYSTALAFRHLSHPINGSAPVLDPVEKKWSRDVLEEYFATVDACELSRLAEGEFRAGRADAASGENDKPVASVPYQRATAMDRPSVTFQAFSSLAMWRRSVRWFDQRPVPRGVVDEAISVAMLSPSACNRLPYHFRVVDDPELVSQVVRIPGGTAGYAENIPAAIVVIGDLAAFASPRDRHLVYIDSCLASMSLLLAFETLGVSTCCINWRGSISGERQIRSLLELKDHETVIMLIAYGYPAEEGLVAFSGKREISAVRRYNNDR